MNIEKIKELREFIAENVGKEVDFDMGLVYDERSRTPCGTSACFAGWANVMENSKSLVPIFSFYSASRAGSILELTEEEEDNLFFTWPDAEAAVSVEWGLERLDEIIRTGVITSADERPSS